MYGPERHRSHASAQARVGMTCLSGPATSLLLNRTTVLPANHLRRTPQHPRQGKNRLHFCLRDILVTLLIGLNHSKGDSFSILPSQTAIKHKVDKPPHALQHLLLRHRYSQTFRSSLMSIGRLGPVSFLA